MILTAFQQPLQLLLLLLGQFSGIERSTEIAVFTIFFFKYELYKMKPSKNLTSPLF